MRVRICADLSDHLRSYVIGDVCELPDDQAARWIEAGYAEAAVEAPEAATLEPEENAAMPRARKR
jgi:hypothetical protein